MKKNYNAPKLLVERFELKQRITESCTNSGNTNGLGSPNSADKASCGWKIGEGLILWPSAPSCTLQKSVDESINGTCYNGINPDLVIFIS